jgi:hypothetical protein
MPPPKGYAKNQDAKSSFFCPPFVLAKQTDGQQPGTKGKGLSCDIEKPYINVSVCTLEKAAREIGFSPCQRGFEFAAVGCNFYALVCSPQSLAGCFMANKSVE